MYTWIYLCDTKIYFLHTFIHSTVQNFYPTIERTKVDERATRAKSKQKYRLANENEYVCSLFMFHSCPVYIWRKWKRHEMAQICMQSRSLLFVSKFMRILSNPTWVEIYTSKAIHHTNGKKSDAKWNETDICSLVQFANSFFAFSLSSFFNIVYEPACKIIRMYSFRCNPCEVCVTLRKLGNDLLLGIVWPGEQWMHSGSFYH